MIDGDCDAGDLFPRFLARLERVAPDVKRVEIKRENDPGSRKLLGQVLMKTSPSAAGEIKILKGIQFFTFVLSVYGFIRRDEPWEGERYTRDVETRCVIIVIKLPGALLSVYAFS